MTRHLILYDASKDPPVELNRRDITNLRPQEIWRIEEDMRVELGEGDFRFVDTGAEG